MTERRFFVENKVVGTKVTIDGDEFNHLSHVLRLKIDDAVTIVCGDGYDYHGKITAIGKTNAQVEITDKVKNENDARLSITLYLGLVKNDSFSSIITKLSELGVKRIVPFMSQYVDVKKTDMKRERLQKVANMAVKQCDRSTPLKVEEVITFDQMLSQVKEYDDVYFAYEKEKGKDSVLSPKGNNVAIIVGAVGGFSEAEVQRVKEENISVVSLGKRILRVETACVALASVLYYESGEWNIE